MNGDSERANRINAGFSEIGGGLAAEPDLPSEISDLLLQALDEIAVRLDRIEQDVTMEDNDANQRSYRRHA